MNQMKNINLKNYLNLPINKILEIKIMNQDNLIYGRLVGAGGLYQSSMQLPPEQFPTGTLKIINDFEKYIQDRSSYKDYDLISLNSCDIECIEQISI